MGCIIATFEYLSQAKGFSASALAAKLRRVCGLRRACVGLGSSMLYIERGDMRHRLYKPSLIYEKPIPMSSSVIPTE